MSVNIVFGQYPEHMPTAEISLYTDKQNYATNETITVSGDVDMQIMPVKSLNVEIKNPYNSIYKNDTIPVNDNGTYHYHLKISDHDMTGTYIVRVWNSYYNVDLQNSFHITSTIPTNNPAGQPIIISQVELDSPFALAPESETCTVPPKPGFINNCLTDLVPNHRVQCSYFIGSNSCEPIHQYTGSTNPSCLDNTTISQTPQWFDMYNTQNNTIQIQLFRVQTLQNMKPWGEENYVPVQITLNPYQKCTYGFGPVDESLTLDQTNMGFAASYTFDGKNYTASTIPLTDTQNDTKTWQYDGDKWNFAEQNTIPIPEFPFVQIILVASITSSIIFYRIRK
jgi:hypothetical protein